MSLGSQKNVIVLGCGFLGKAAALLFASRGWQATGIARHMLPSEENFSSLVCDITDLEAVQKITPLVTSPALLIYAVSSGKGDADTYASLYRDGLQRVMEAWRPEKTIFVSSTSVYAQTAGEIVTELSPTQPERATSRLLLEAESIALDAGGIVARFSGIYGPGRSVLLKKFLNNTAVVEEGGHRWINQIHRDDGAEALWALGTTQRASGIYIVSDDTPIMQHDLYAMMAAYYKKPLPPQGPRDLDRKRGWTSKRLSNARLKSLGWHPFFPSYRDALPTLTSSLS